MAHDERPVISPRVLALLDEAAGRRLRIGACVACGTPLDKALREAGGLPMPDAEGQHQRVGAFQHPQPPQHPLAALTCGNMRVLRLVLAPASGVTSTRAGAGRVLRVLPRVLEGRSAPASGAWVDLRKRFYPGAAGAPGAEMQPLSKEAAG